MRKYIGPLLETCGIVIVGIGLWFAWPPLSFVVVGGLIIFLAQGIGRRQS